MLLCKKSSNRTLIDCFQCGLTCCMYYIRPHRGPALVHCVGRALGRALCQGKGLEPKEKEMEDPQLV